jgi:hypothetical protein
MKERNLKQIDGKWYAANRELAFLKQIFRRALLKTTKTEWSH